MEVYQIDDQFTLSQAVTGYAVTNDLNGSKTAEESHGKLKNQRYLTLLTQGRQASQLEPSGKAISNLILSA
jgi:hypothetical protein